MTASSPNRQKPSRVWLVDDDSDLLALLERRIQGCGWQSRGFVGGAELEQALQDETPHVLVLDRLLPEQSGMHLLQRLRLQGYRFPVLILSALGSADARIEGLEIGADDYMAKPFLWRELELRLQRLLDLGFSPTISKPDGIAYTFNSLQFTPSTLELSGPSGNGQILSRGDATLLETFCRSPQIILERADLLRSTGSLVDATNSRSLDVRISKLRSLLNHCAPGTGLLIEAVRGRGYRLNANVEAMPAASP